MRGVEPSCGMGGNRTDRCNGGSEMFGREAFGNFPSSKFWCIQKQSTRSRATYVRTFRLLCSVLQLDLCNRSMIPMLLRLLSHNCHGLSGSTRGGIDRCEGCVRVINLEPQKLFFPLFSWSVANCGIF